MMNCPIGNHPLVNGVLVESQRIVRFIQKVVIDFRPQEKICQRCHDEAVKTYKDKMKRAIAKTNSNIHYNSVSTVQTSSPASSSISHYSMDSDDSLASVVTRMRKYTAVNSNLEAVVTTVAEASSVRVSQEPSTSAPALSNGISVHPALSNGISVHPAILSTSTAKTVRNGDIRDFLTSKNAEYEHLPTPKILENISQASSGSEAISKKRRRDSQMPTTSAAAAAASVISSCHHQVAADSDDDDEPRMSLNYYNGTRLPDVQPFPPRRKPRLYHPGPEIMQKYIGDITGG